MPYNLNIESDKIKYVVYHELGHASHYTKVNESDFWEVYINHIITHGGYGDGNDDQSELIAVSEPFADLIGHTFADITYGTAHSNGDPNIHRWIYILETEFGMWIPWGIYYDLTDNNSVNPVGVSDPVNDNISGFNVGTLFDLLDENTRDMDDLKQKLDQNLPTGATSNQLSQIFSEYGF